MNPGPWNNLFGVVFPDNPIGAGFGIASTTDEIPKDEKTVAKHFFVALTALIKLNPSFKSRPIYINGESYAGKYVPAIGYTCVAAYYSGLINTRQMLELENVQSETVNLIEKGKWSEATDVCRRVLHMLQNMTGLATLYDFRRKMPYGTKLVQKVLNIEEVQKVLSIQKSKLWKGCSGVVNSALRGDVMKSVKFMVEELVKHTRVLLYQGKNLI
ncbi:hypothetical protein GIB67_022074 [Kingdonia uniflora]|uniref:Carboxypeptidase n=1 Tax=Kingdonia uniflora TaxID=39325 RepID=A0A7J7MUI5_9MAGN|nr:hypothetical protein GIB67_022074 [Kingdonia uniflora]